MTPQKKYCDITGLEVTIIQNLRFVGQTVVHRKEDFLD